MNKPDPYITLMLSLAGLPKSKRNAKAAQLGWRKATAAEQRAGAGNYIRSQGKMTCNS